MFKKVVRWYRDGKRLDAIIAIVVSEGFGYLVHNHSFKKSSEGFSSHNGPVRARNLLERLGPTFVKLGQLLSVRPDRIPLAYAQEFEKLQDAVPPFPFEEVERIIKEDFDEDINSLFRSFDKKPLASASISQVHKATLKNGTRVAVKVLRPGIVEQMREDIDIMYQVAKLVERKSRLKKLEPKKIIDEFSCWTMRELDLRNEARNCRIFDSNFRSSKKVKIPKVYDRFSTKRVLVMEFIDGVRTLCRS